MNSTLIGLARQLAARVRDRGPRVAAREILWRLRFARRYARWRRQVEPQLRGPAERWRHGQGEAGPVFSVVMPTFNASPRFLREAVESVRAQTYPRWQLCIADDASTAPGVRETLEGHAAADARIRVCFREHNGHIARASNSAIELATGDFVVLLDHDDLLAPDALAELALLLDRHPDADMIYSDEDKIDAAGRRFGPFFKPQWSPESLLARNYICHLGAYRHDLLKRVGGFRVGLEGAQDYDLVLRFTEATDRIHHIPKILYHWRVHPESAASGAAAKPYAYRAGERALSEALQRRGEPGSVAEMPVAEGRYAVRLAVAQPATTSILIDAAEDVATLERGLAALFASDAGAAWEVLLVSPAGDDHIAAFQSRWEARRSAPVRVVPVKAGASPAARWNEAVGQATGDYLLLGSARLEPVTAGWLSGLVEQAQRPAIGAVGPLVLDGRGDIHRAGIILGPETLYAHALRGFWYPCAIHSHFVHCLNNVSAISGDCLMCRRAVFEQVGGFEERFTQAGHDVDLCLKMLEAGYRNVYVPHVQLLFRDDCRRPAPSSFVGSPEDAQRLRERWGRFFENDPYYHPQLSRRRADFSLPLPSDTQP